jgi:hypothetical protein
MKSRIQNERVIEFPIQSLRPSTTDQTQQTYQSHSIAPPEKVTATSVISTPPLWLEIAVDGEVWDILRFRRKYACCPQGCGRSGGLVLAAGPWPRRRMRLLVTCETCAFQWRPNTGPALRTLVRCRRQQPRMDHGSEQLEALGTGK